MNDRHDDQQNRCAFVVGVVITSWTLFLPRARKRLNHPPINASLFAAADSLHPLHRRWSLSKQRTSLRMTWQLPPLTKREASTFPPTVNANLAALSRPNDLNAFLNATSSAGAQRRSQTTETPPPATTPAHPTTARFAGATTPSRSTRSAPTLLPRHP